MIRSTALHLRSRIHAIPKWKTPMPTSVHTLKTCSPELPEDLFLFYKTLMCGLREPTGDQIWQVIQTDLFHDKEDTDVDTGDQQAVDDAEYDDGSSTDSEWSDDSVETSKCVNKVAIEDERLIKITLSGDPVDIVIIQGYMPTSSCDEEEIEKSYEKLDEMLEVEKGNCYLVLMGDWNAVEVGQYGLGIRNERGDRLVEHCRKHKLVMTNTIFENEKRRRYTWKMPGDINRYQIDYIMIRQRYRNSVLNSRAYPGADADTDHNLVCMTVKLRMKRIIAGKKTLRWDRDQLKEENGISFRKYVEEQIENKEKSPWEINERWKDLKNIIIKGAKKHIGYNNRKRIRKPWVTANMLNKMDERKKWKNVNNKKGKEMYKKLNNELRRETESAREKWWEEQCTELENIDKKGRSDLMYNKVKELTREKSKDKENTSIMGKDGIIIDDPTKVCERWKEYIEELYDKKGKPTEIYLEEAKTLVDEERAMMGTIHKRQRKWIGHILRSENMLRDVMEGHVMGRRQKEDKE
ncbi:Craniofacial development protein 2 [Nymphon striatum]|nr:Craniofacial development protein 2 [Nymphon striatum]